MKLVGRIASYFFLAVSFLLAIVFAFVELRCLFAGDFLLMNSPAISFITYLFRGLFFLIVAAYCICLFILCLKRINPTLAHCIVAPSLFVASLFSIFFYVQSIYLVVIFIALIPTIIVFTRKFLI